MAINAEQMEFVKMVGDFMKKEVEPYKAQWDEEGTFPLEAYKKAAEIGLNMLEIPEELGGAGLDHETMALIYEEGGYWDAGFAMTLFTTSVQALKAVIMYGNDEQKEMMMDIIGNGGFGAWALTEANTGSNASALTTTYRKEGDEYVINGSKAFCTLGAYADVFMVFATKDKSLGKDGVSAFIVPKQPGIIIDKSENKMGMRLSNTASVTFDEVRVPAANLVGQEGKGMRIALGTLNLGRLEAASLATGITRRALEEATKYAKVRKVFDNKPIIDHQMVTSLLGDIAINYEASRALVQEGMRAFEENDPNVRLLASAAKVFCSEAASKSADIAIQVLGGYGYSHEYPVEKLFRDSRILQILEGTTQIQKIVIGRELDKKYN